MTERNFTTTVISDDDSSMCVVEIPFDPKVVFGKVRAPVKVTINGHTFRSTIARMGGQTFIPLRRRNREAAKVEGGQKIRVSLELDVEPRVIEPPADFVNAMKAGKVLKNWEALSYSHQREHVEAIDEAVKPETRQRRIDKAVQMLANTKPKKRG
ncbi:MAG: YdeI/OmpD-associated family protein [Planctomycetes bacterium]|nr:YdeI/OmpD-associated family protein [Planctomycetota bacterium]